MSNRAISEAEQALVQIVVDARNDPKRIPDPMIRDFAERVALEAIPAEQFARLKSLHDAAQAAKYAFSDAMDELPPYARALTLAKLEKAWREAQTEEEDNGAAR
jgi:hypothetical protein